MKKVSISGSNAENFSEIRVHCFLFKDSLAFCPSSLENLAKKHKENEGEFKILKNHKLCTNSTGQFSDEKYKLLSSGKSPFPYDYLTKFEILYETQLPPQQAFYNKLKNIHLSDFHVPIK